MSMATSDKLAQALIEAGAPAEMVVRARGGYYDDYKSPIALPCLQLVNDATAAGLTAIVERAKNGDFDATVAESDAWYEAEGRQIVKDAGLPLGPFEKPKENTDARA